MKNKISFIRIQTTANGSVIVDFIPSNRRTRTYEEPSDDSLYRILNNDMISDICPFVEQNGLLLEVYPMY